MAVTNCILIYDEGKGLPSALTNRSLTIRRRIAMSNTRASWIHKHTSTMEILQRYSLENSIESHFWPYLAQIFSWKDINKSEMWLHGIEYVRSDCSTQLQSNSKIDRLRSSTHSSSHHSSEVVHSSLLLHNQASFLLAFGCIGGFSAYVDTILSHNRPPMIILTYDRS